ncbi:hypothetical protein G7Y89_g8821 [Cudoniella acicularis]|uniref:Uncharacterized protein n=1 Tax=Cudoniella acicularis TaxID=354080 RepID=A0A8H4RHG8_9HELO|nr:hypothetical protein G7Y89_g8821 [Cudoniella acicularis]
MRPISAKEREALLLGWPEDGGVWVMKATNQYNFGGEPGSWRLRNAYTMEERCKAVEMSGALYYKYPEDCDSVKRYWMGLVSMRGKKSLITTMTIQRIFTVDFGA